MPQSLSRILIHTIFSTKNRENSFTDSAFRSEMHAYVGGVAKTLACFPIQIGGTADHIHILSTLDRSICVADFVKETKRVSTDWIQKQNRGLAQFHWQAGYGVFSVSESNCEVVTKYIQNQEEHHRKTTFQDEYRIFCEKHAVKVDERYVWD
ncbi:MAG: IS200/IS605 family transposase [Verrucomicrobiales bacterium]|nr:IS200/IS605 family transposase [Verrucomicrobiales bacterium]